MRWLKKLFGQNKVEDINFEKKVIFIVGLYKCGTSWLSLALGKHPNAMSLPELDVIRAFADESSANLSAKTVDERVKYIFSASNYGRLPANITENSHGLNANELFNYLEDNASKRIILKNSFTSQQFDRKSASQLIGQGSQLMRYVNYWDLDITSIKKLIEDAIYNPLSTDAIRNFCRIHQAFSGNFLVLKSADQINHIKHLKNIMPNSPRILIIRDGRDMAISATKFEQYIRQKTHFTDIWGVVEHGFWERLQQWAHVIRKIEEYKKKSDLYVLRYEDLSSDFEQTFTKLLDWIGLDSSKYIVDQIKKETSFEKMSGGRSKGNEDLSSNIRKGITGEWKVILNNTDKERAWEIAGKELAIYQYEKI